ncbi:MAG: L,D-transpeptidase family protein [Rhodobiaceae bacterium]|nr:L,D-transpeptidase family protein [Rhodobiaceae bacterium]MCC0055455.1 L,D-transpeptidase family protein [Rhodobiaceae bacterium]
MRGLLELHVRRLPGASHRGILIAGNLSVPCALGRSGTTHAKREGDGATPIATLPLRALHFRADRISPPVTGLPARAIGKSDGWCDSPHHPLYNRLVSHPFPASAEHMWRDDRLYDCVVELGWNDDPVIPGKGSAIFMHICREGFAPTEGCVAIEPQPMARLLPRLSAETVMIIYG